MVLGASKVENQAESCLKTSSNPDCICVASLFKTLTYELYADTRLQSKAYQGGKEDATQTYRFHVEEPTMLPKPAGG